MQGVGMTIGHRNRDVGGARLPRETKGRIDVGVDLLLLTFLMIEHVQRIRHGLDAALGLAVVDASGLELALFAGEKKESPVGRGIRVAIVVARVVRGEVHSRMPARAGDERAVRR